MTDVSQGRQHARPPGPSPLNEVHQMSDMDPFVPETQLEETVSCYGLESEAGDLDPEAQATLAKCAVGPSLSVSTSSQLEHIMTQTTGVVRPVSAKTSDLTSDFAFAIRRANTIPPQKDSSLGQPLVSHDVAMSSSSPSMSVATQQGNVTQIHPKLRLITLQTAIPSFLLMAYLIARRLVLLIRRRARDLNIQVADYHHASRVSIQKL